MHVDWCVFVCMHVKHENKDKDVFLICVIVCVCVRLCAMRTRVHVRVCVCVCVYVHVVFISPILSISLSHCPPPLHRRTHPTITHPFSRSLSRSFFLFFALSRFSSLFFVHTLSLRTGAWCMYVSVCVCVCVMRQTALKGKS